MAAVAEHRRLRLDLDCIVRDARASDLPRLEWFGIYAHLRRMEEANYRDVEAGTKLWLVADVNGFPVGHLKVNLRVDDPSAVDATDGDADCLVRRLPAANDWRSEDAQPGDGGLLDEVASIDVAHVHIPT